MLDATAETGALPPGDDPASLYESDEFRLYCFKILPCSRRVPHEWSSCPFAHPTEKAKRRNIRTHSYDCEMCPAIVNGEECPLGSGCPHSHNVFESWLHPQKYRTLLCKDKDKCTRSVCFFAHGEAQLRTPLEPSDIPHTGRLDVHRSSSIADLGANSNCSAEQPPAGIGSSLIAPLYGQQPHNSRATSWPLAAAATAYSSSNQTFDTQQSLTILAHQMRIARREADQQREAAQKAEAWLQAVTAALAEEQATMTAAGTGPRLVSQPPSMPMSAGSTLGASNTAQADISIGTHGTSSCSSLQPPVQQQPATLRFPAQAVTASILAPTFNSNTCLLQLASQQCPGMQYVPPPCMTAPRVLENVPAAGWCAMSGAGLIDWTNINGQSALRAQGTAGVNVNAHQGPSTSAPVALLAQAHAPDAAALYVKTLQGPAAHGFGPAASVGVTHPVCRVDSQPYLASSTACGALVPLQPWTSLQTIDCSMIPATIQHTATNSQQLLDHMLLPFT